MSKDPTANIIGGIKTVGDVVNDITLAPVGALARSMKGKPLSWWIERLILTLVFVRLGLYVVETDFYRTSDSFKSPPFFLWAERVIACIFTIEYFVRWKNSSNPRLWPRRPTAIIDLLSILPFWIGFFVPVSWLGGIRAMRVISVLKFYRYSPKAQQLIEEIWKGKGMIGQIFVFNMGLITLFGALVYEMEKYAQPDKFARVFDGFWYSVVTASTTGYGDLFPVTLGGRILAICFIFTEVAFMSIYIGIFSSAANRAFKKELEAMGG
jgi:voltage-gated potassium channel